MSKPSGVRHDNYEILNLIGYGLAKYETELTQALGFTTKADLYKSMISRGVATTTGTLKNRQDLFNPLVRNTKVGWRQNQDKYLHRKLLLDSLFGQLDAAEYAALVENYLFAHFPVAGEVEKRIAPILKSKFRQLQETGQEAELYFMNNYRSIVQFADATLDDARLFGDGYDFQITVKSSHMLAEVKGVRGPVGGIRLTKNEYEKAIEFESNFCLVVVSRLESTPRISALFDPTKLLPLLKKTIASEQVYYTSPSRRW